MSKTDFEKYDEVKIIDRGKRYSTFPDWFDGKEYYLNISDIAKYEMNNNKAFEKDLEINSFKILYISRHSLEDDTRLAFIAPNKDYYGHTYLIAIDGLEKIEKQVVLTYDELIKIAEEKLGCKVVME